MNSLIGKLRSRPSFSLEFLFQLERTLFGRGLALRALLSPGMLALLALGKYAREKERERENETEGKKERKRKRATDRARDKVERAFNGRHFHPYVHLYIPFLENKKT